MAGKIDKFIRTIPKVFKPGTNPVMNAFIKAFADSDDEISTQIQNTKAQLFVRTAEGSNLDRLASSLGVSRPVSIGLLDPDFQELIPNLSLKAKQIRKTFYDTADVFWGPLFSRTNLESRNTATFDVSAGDIIKVSIDNGDTQEIKAVSADIASAGAATAEELVVILNRIKGATASVIEDSVTGDKTVSLRTNTPGPRGAVEILTTSTMVSVTKLDFEVKKHELLQQDQRVMIYEIRPNEMIIEIPAVVPALKRTLRGSHHFHADSTLEPPVAPNNGIWQGSFLFDPSGSPSAFTVSNQKTIIEDNLTAGNVFTQVTVDSTSDFRDTSGFLIFGWGTDTEEQPVGFRGVPNDKTILLDPGFVFQKTHLIGENVNVLVSQRPYRPRANGTDLAIYLTSPSDARAVVELILKDLAAAGVIVNFVILAPTYRYLIDNPYLVEDDAPSI